jgi:hypothetical protein
LMFGVHETEIDHLMYPQTWNEEIVRADGETALV